MRPSTFKSLLSELRRQAPLAVTVALLAALAVGLLSARTQPLHRAITSAVVVPGSSTDPAPSGDPTTSDDAARLASAYVAAATDPSVLAAATRGTGWSPEQASANITVRLGSVPGVIEVLVTVPGAEGSAEQARQVASAVPAALQAEVLTEHAAAVAVWTDELQKQLASVRAQYSAAEPGSANQARADADVVVRLQQLSSIYRAQPPALMNSAAAISLPDLQRQPLLDALAVFVLTAVVVAALGMLLTGRRGAAVTRANGRRLARGGRGTYLEVACSSAVGAPALLPLRGEVGRSLAAGREVVLLVGPGTDIAEVQALLVPADLDTTHLVVAHLDHPWWLYVEATTVGQVVLVATYGAASRHLAKDAVHAAAGMGSPAHVVLLTGATFRTPTRPRTTATGTPTTPSPRSAPSSAPSAAPSAAPSGDHGQFPAPQTSDR